MQRLNKICAANADRGTKIKVFMLPDDGFLPLGAFQGDAEALKMMSDLFLAMSELTQKDDFSMGPDSAGSVFFAPGSDCGFYIDRV